jgi:hypothetical protein
MLDKDLAGGNDELLQADDAISAKESVYLT